MSDVGREFTRLRDEIAEANKQMRCTEAGFSDLAAVFGAFERRFAQLERRQRFSQLSAHVVVAAAVAVATFLGMSARTRAVETELAAERAVALEARSLAAARDTELQTRLEAVAKAEKRRESANATATRLVEHLAAERSKDAADALQSLDFSGLDPLARRLLQERVESLRREATESAYKWGMELLNRRRRRDAIDTFRRVVSLWPEGPRANAARYLVATHLREAKRYDESADAYSELRQHETDEAVLEEARYFEGLSRARVGELDAAEKLFADVIKEGGRHAGDARYQLGALTRSETPPTPTE